MKRSHLEHLIRAAGAVAGDDSIVVIGSQAILGSIENPPEPLTLSAEADLFPLHRPERSSVVEGALGEHSQFHDTYGYYAQGVGPETAVLPASWRSRLHRLRTPATNNVTGLCLDPHDLALAKYVAAREKDRDFNRVMIQHRIVVRDKLLALLKEMPLDAGRRRTIAAHVNADCERFAPGRRK